MAERTLLTERVQLGFEENPGVAGVVNSRLLSASIDFGPDGDIDVFRPMGSKYPALSIVGREWSSGSLEGKPTYDEMLYWLCLCLGTPVSSDLEMGATTAREHIWHLDSLTANDPMTATVERGGEVRAHRSLYTYLNAIGLDYSRAAIDLSGDVMAAAIEDGISLTDSGIDELPLIPVLPKDTDIYVDPTLAAIGTSKLLRAVGANWKLGSRFQQLWPINTDFPSFATVYEGEPDTEVGLSLEADATGMAVLDQLRTGDTTYVRIESNGPEIESGHNYRLTCDFACKVKDMPAFGDEDDLMTMDWALGMFHDGAWEDGQSGMISLVCAQPAPVGEDA